MTLKEIIIALSIHLIIPLIGLLYFLRLKKQMKSENVQEAPTTELFIIFATYGGLLLVTLTTILWQWSGMASLGTFYLVVGAPIAMGVIAHRQKKKVNISKYHRWTNNLSFSYFIIAPITLLILFLIADKC